jgi:hypothetical protein
MTAEGRKFSFTASACRSLSGLHDATSAFDSFTDSNRRLVRGPLRPDSVERLPPPLSWPISRGPLPLTQSAIVECRAICEVDFSDYDVLKPVH